jgi:alanine racemase
MSILTTEKIIKKVTSPTKLSISLAAIKHNLDGLQKKNPEMKFMAMVKAYGYGLGPEIALHLESMGIDFFGVAYVDEGARYRCSGISKEILVLHSSVRDIEAIVEHGLSIAVSDDFNLEKVSELAIRIGKTINVHLHVNTGMNRFGCDPKKTLSLAKSIIKRKGLHLQGLMTHFPAADDPQHDPFTHSQICQIQQLDQELRSHQIKIPYLHAANSSGFLRFNQRGFHLARVGLSLFGIPLTKACEGHVSLHSAVSLTSEISYIHQCKQGETVGYGRTYKVQQNQEKIAVVPIGYHDGISRRYSGKGYLMVKGYKAPFVGNICMDYLMINVSKIPRVSVGDPVLIFGEDFWGNIPPCLFASWGETIPHELLASLSPRIPREYL